MDLCVIPSLWPETGPITVLDAFGAGLPVIGSRLGGIMELVRDGVDGLLFDAGDASALQECILRLFHDPVLLKRLRAGIQPNRTMLDVAQDYIELYNSLE